MGKMHIDLSPAKVILCDSHGQEFNIKNVEKHREEKAKQEITNIKHACFGNTLYDAWRYLFVVGTNTEKCIPYNGKFGKYTELDELGSFTTFHKIPTCSQVSGMLGDMCADFTYNAFTLEETGTPAKFYKCLHFYAIAGIPEDGGGEENIRHNIFTWGPVSTGMLTYPDFYTFDAKNEIYKWNGNGPQVGGHAVEIVGWGVEGKIPYWIIKNSWGKEWGDGGYFRMVRGINDCDIEENVMTAVPDFFYGDDERYVVPYIWGETPETIRRRREISTFVTEAAGGIDSETGFTRRVMSTKPWLKFTRPVKLKELPDFTNWAAGRDAYGIGIKTSQDLLKMDFDPKDTMTLLIVGVSVFLVLVIVAVSFRLRN